MARQGQFSWRIRVNWSEGVFGHKEKQAKTRERGDGKCGNEVTWSLAERGDSPMRNVLRLETKGCPRKKRTRWARWGGLSVGEGRCLCDLPDKGGGGGEAMGNPLGNPHSELARRERDEARRESVCFGRS